MAPRTKARPTYADLADREPNWRHIAFSEWASENTGLDIDVKTAQVCFTLLNPFRESEEYAAAAEAVAAERAKAEEAKLRERAAKIRDRAARAQEKAAQYAAQLEQLGDVAVEEPPAPRRGARKAAAKPAAAPKAPAKRAAAAPEEVPTLQAVPSDDLPDDDDEF